MKSKALLIGLCLVSLSAAGVSASLALQSKDPIEAKADTVEGTVTIDTTINWSSAACKLAVYFFDDTVNPKKEGWSNLVSLSNGYGEAEVSYSLNFTPKNMIAVRYDPVATTTGWNNKWNQTNDLAYGQHIRITDANWASPDDYASIEGKTSGGTWGTLEVLDGIKLNHSHNCEYYFENITLTANTEFKIRFAGNLYDSMSIGDGVSASDFGRGDNNNIKVLKKGTYDLFFNAASQNLHIANPIVAAADKWSEEFLDDVGCDPNGVNLPSGWSTVAASYAEITNDDVLDYIYIADPVEDGSYTEQAMYLYDWAVLHHPSLTKFVVDSEGNERVPKLHLNTTNNTFLDNKGTAIAVIVLIGCVSFIGGTAYLMLRKRKEQ
ncbi:MAG: hypothetical protein K6E11_03600 [Bacilli bacterium]|nr:hypothetical protein [Bacilli bacterium]